MDSFNGAVDDTQAMSNSVHCPTDSLTSKHATLEVGMPTPPSSIEADGHHLPNSNSAPNVERPMSHNDPDIQISSKNDTEEEDEDGSNEDGEDEDGKDEEDEDEDEDQEKSSDPDDSPVEESEESDIELIDDDELIECEIAELSGACKSKPHPYFPHRSTNHNLHYPSPMSMPALCIPRPYSDLHVVQMEREPRVVDAATALILLNTIEPFTKLCPDLFEMVEDYFDDPVGRTVKAWYHHDASRWTYFGGGAAKVPYVLTSFNKKVKVEALKYVAPAPAFGPGGTYPYFDYNLDTLVLKYARCGTEVEEKGYYRQVIRSAIHSIRSSPYDLKFLEVDYCPEMAPSLVGFVLMFRALPGLEQLTLRGHDHYPYPETHRHHEGRIEHDHNTMDQGVGNLRHHNLPFNIEVYDYFGHQFV
jgi:hypothetical protein